MPTGRHRAGSSWAQRGAGSPESKDLRKVGQESNEDQHVGRHARDDSPAWARAGGWRRTLFSNSLGLVMGAILLLA
jgi:hypothetical protein